MDIISDTTTQEQSETQVLLYKIESSIIIGTTKL